MPTHTKQAAKPRLDKSQAMAVEHSSLRGQAPRHEHSLPHELDETPDTGLPEEGARDVVKQAARDVRRGLRDTERRGAPSDVPGPSDDPQHTRGAEVPVRGKRGQR